MLHPGKTLYSKLTTCGEVAGLFGEPWCGAYSAQAEVRAFGIILLELMFGRRLVQDEDGIQALALWGDIAVPISALAAQAAVLALVTRADAAWPPHLVLPLAVLAAACIHPDPDKRPAGVTAVRARLFLIKAIPDGGGSLGPCALLCGEEALGEGCGVRCKGLLGAPSLPLLLRPVFARSCWQDKHRDSPLKGSSRSDRVSF